ncbi:MAG: glycosyltransferase [Mariprofundaceae bacterium]|nr:glycosyltransferase [Mariprofundaceae bacterium]
MSVSVLICTRERRKMLDALLADLRTQDYQGEIQIVVVEETDDPRPPEGVDYVPHPVRDLGIAHARNLALKHARHELVVFVDDDCRVAPDWLQKLLSPLDDPDVLGVQGGVTVPEGTNAIGWAESLLGFPGGGIARIHHAGNKAQDTIEVSTLNAAYRMQAMMGAGGFPEAAQWGGEDYILAKRVAARGRLLFVPEAIVRHAARGSLPAIWRWFARRGMAEVGLWRGGLAPAGYGLFMLRSSLFLKLAALLAVAPWLGWWLPLLLPVAVTAMIWGRLRWIWSDTTIPRQAFWITPLVRLTMDIAADYGRIRAMLDRTR